MSALLEALGYIGDLLNKPGRSIRGALAGRPEELAAFLPFSDTMGLTDPDRQVSGRGLLEHYGMDKDAGWMGDVAGFGAQVATDPLSYLGGAGLAKLGSKLFRGRGAAAAATEAAAPAASLAAPALEEASPMSQALRLNQEARPAMATMPEINLGHEAAPLTVPGSPVNPNPVPAPPPLAPVFYSRAEQAAQKLPENIKGQALLNALKKHGVSEEELQWTKMGDLAKGEGKIAKADVLKHLDENKIRVEEVWKGGEHEARFRYLRNKEENEMLHNGPPMTPGEVNELKVLDESSSTIAGYSKYQTPGGQNYRELLLKLPGNKYEQPHFLDKGLMAHVRMNDRIGPNGEKILHMEELQSDMHQAGAKTGYANEIRGWEALDANGMQAGYGPTKEAALADARSAGHLDPVTYHPHTGQIPDAPFKDTWHELAMKRMIRYASEHGYDKITWNTGEMVQKMVGGELSGQIGFYGSHLPPKKIGMLVEAELTQKIGSKSAMAIMDPYSYPQGYDAAQELAKNLVKEGDLSPLQLRLLKGEVPYEAYGEQLLKNAKLPGWANKYGKQWGVKVEPETITVPKGGPTTGFHQQDTTVPGMTLAPKMRSDVLTKGQALLGIPPLLLALRENQGEQQ